MILQDWSRKRILLENKKDKLNELDTSKVEPMTHIFEMGNVFREDEVTNGDDRDAMLANAPEVKEGQYKVPKTVE